MKKNHKLQRICIMVVLLVVLSMIAGCKSQERLSPTSDKQEEKIPPSLGAMDEGIHSVIEQMEGIEDINRITPEDIKPQEQQQQSIHQGDMQQNEEGQQAQQQPQQEAQQQLSPQEEQENREREKQAQVLEKWEKAQEDLKSIHESWNAYESTALKDGADSQKIDQAEKAINNLTSYVEEKDMDKVLVQSNEVILAISDFMDLYKGNPEGIFGKMEYMARQSYMDAKQGEWLMAKEKLQQKDALVTGLRQRMNIEEKHKVLIEQLTLSLEDLQVAIEEENLPLLEIKRDIVIKNIETFKEEL